MKLNFNSIVEKRKDYPILSGDKDELIETMILDKYSDEFALVTLGILQKEIENILANKFIDIIIQIPSPFVGTAINFCIVHFSKNKPQKLLTGIYKGNVCEKKYKLSKYDSNSVWMISGEYTEDFKALINEINQFLDHKEITREDLNLNSIEYFNKDNLNPLYYTKQAIKIREELQESDYKLLSDFAEIITAQEEKNITAKYMDSTNMIYPFVYSDLKIGEIKRAIKIQKGDIICLLVGEQPKFYLYNENFEDIYIKSGNYCILRCKNKKYLSYLVNYLNDEKARLYFSSTVRGNCIPHLTKKDLINLKVIIPNDHMLKIADETQAYLMNQKKLSPYEINELIRKSYKVKYKKETQKMISNDIINAVSNMKIQVLSELINEDLKEVEICFDNGAYKSAIILCGSILEAVLLDWLSEYENTEEVSNIAIDENGRDMGLGKIIKRLKEIIKPYWYEYRKAHEIRETRNMVHPKEYIKNNKKITYEECKEIIENLKDIMESKERRHKA